MNSTTRAKPFLRQIMVDSTTSVDFMIFHVWALLNLRFLRARCELDNIVESMVSPYRIYDMISNIRYDIRNNIVLASNWTYL